MTLAVLVPTRNRPDLALLAVASVLRERRAGTQVWLSDNSDDAAAKAEIDRLLPEGVRLVRPPAPLPMSAHWSWAAEQVMADGAVDHLTVLTDRMVLRSGALDTLVGVLAMHPNDLVSWNHDMVDDRDGVRLVSYQWTGQVLAVDPARLLELSAQGVFPSVLPRGLNTAIPRSVYEQVRQHYGQVFRSVAPDFCFAYQALTLVPRLLYLDQSLLVHHSQGRSTGASYGRGSSAGATDQIARDLGVSGMNPHAPVPELHALANAMYNELCFVATAGVGRPVPPVDLPRYLEVMARDTAGLESVELKQQNQELLAQHGWRPTPTAAPVPRRELLANRRTKPFWIRVARFGLRPPVTDRFRFSDRDEALAFADASGARRRRDPKHLAELRPDVPADLL